MDAMMGQLRLYVSSCIDTGTQRSPDNADSELWSGVLQLQDTPAQTYESRCTQIRTRPICSAIPFMPHFAAVLLVFITLPEDPLPGALAPLPATTTHELLQGLWQMPLVATIFGEVPRLQHSICESQIIHSREMPNQDLKTHCGNGPSGV